MHLLILLVEICAFGFVTINARPRELNRQPKLILENEKQSGHASLNQYIANLNISSDDEQLHRIVQGLLEENRASDQYVTKNVELNQDTNTQLSERIIENTDSNTEPESVENHVDNVYNDGSKLSDSENLQNSIPTNPKVIGSVSLNHDNENHSDVFNSTDTLLSSVNELKPNTGEISLDYGTEVRKSEKQQTETSIDKADKNPPDQHIYVTNAVRETEEKRNEDVNIPDKNVAVKEAVNAEQSFPNSLEPKTENDKRGNGNGRFIDGFIDIKNVNRDQKTDESEQVTTLKYLYTESVVKASTEKSVKQEDVSRLSDIMRSSLTSLSLETEPVSYKLVTIAGNTDSNNNEEKNDKSTDKESTIENRIEPYEEKVLISKELFEKSSVPAKGHDINTDVDNGQLPYEPVQKATTEDDRINMEQANVEEITTPITLKSIGEEVSSKNIIELGKQVIPSQDVTLVKTEVTSSQNIINTVTKENSIYRKNNEEIITSTDRNISKGMDDINDQLNHRVHSATTRASEEIEHKDDNKTTDKETTHELNHDSLFVTPELSDTDGKSNSNTPANSVDSGSSLTKTAARKATATTAIKQKHVNDTPLSFHSLEENVKVRSTKQSSIPAKKPIQSAKTVETSNNKLDISGGSVEETDYKIDEDLKQKDDIPCECIGDSEQMYTASALIACTVGGVFIGGFVVLLLFNARDKCKRYVQGDYRRVPMEYDFELNPRLKTH